MNNQDDPIPLISIQYILNKNNIYIYQNIIKIVFGSTRRKYFETNSHEQLTNNQILRIIRVSH